MTDELLFNYISGQAQPEEILNVQEWVDGSEDRKRELARIKNVWILAGLGNEIDLSRKELEIEHIWNIIRQLNQKEQRKAFRLRFIRYAAAILLLIGFSGTVGYFISNLSTKSKSEFTEIIVPKGERSTVVLPDGSTVQLNSDSHLKFVSSFNSGKRKVTLEGEGFFKVTHDQSRPFVVEAHGIQIEVLGTSFNVSSYPDDSFITTYLVSGKVKINDSHDDIFLSPNEAYSYNKITHESINMKISDQRFSNWTKGILTINGETIGELAKKIERRFNVQIIFGDNEVKQHMYTGSIRDEDLVTVLQALEFASSIKYERKGDSITLFSKR
jgi:transmembrane sensor